MQITISNQNGNHANQYLACNHRKYFLVLRSWPLSEGDVENYWNATGCHLNVLAKFVRVVVLCVWLKMVI